MITLGFNIILKYRNKIFNILVLGFIVLIKKNIIRLKKNMRNTLIFKYIPHNIPKINPKAIITIGLITLTLFPF